MTDSATPTAALAPASWAPPWAQQVLQTLGSGTASVFVLHGNTQDYFQGGGETSSASTSASIRYGGLAGFLAEQMFGRYDLVLHYDLARGLVPLAGGSAKRLQAMVSLASDEQVGRDDVGREPAQIFASLDARLRRSPPHGVARCPHEARVVDRRSHPHPIEQLPHARRKRLRQRRPHRRSREHDDAVPTPGEKPRGHRSSRPAAHDRDVYRCCHLFRYELFG